MDKFSLDSSQKQEFTVMNALYAEMILDKAIRDFQIDQIQKKIDQSLKSKNKEEFLRLTEQLKDFYRN